jgi:hypothetical protein
LVRSVRPAALRHQSSFQILDQCGVLLALGIGQPINDLVNVFGPDGAEGCKHILVNAIG